MYLILMVYACLISCSLINKSKCHSLAYFNLRWTCVVILHKSYYKSKNASLAIIYFAAVDLLSSFQSVFCMANNFAAGII